jgi:hypothetical protein
MRSVPEVPDPVVDRALAIFRPVATVSRPRLARLVAALIFDSFAEPATAGTRSGGSGTRRLSYRAENLELDLLKPESISGPLALQFMSGRRVLHKTQTDESGEFQIDLPVGQRLTLRLTHKDKGIEVDVPLGLLWPARRISKPRE